MKKALLATALFIALAFTIQPKAKADAWCGNYNATPYVGLFWRGPALVPEAYCVGNNTGVEWGFILISWTSYWDLRPEYGD